MILQVQS